MTDDLVDRTRKFANQVLMLDPNRREQSGIIPARHGPNLFFFQFEKGVPHGALVLPVDDWEAFVELGAKAITIDLGQ